MTISAAAIARGQTGFLKPRHDWRVVVTLTNGKQEEALKTHNARDARRRATLIRGLSRDQHGKYSGAQVALSKDGITIDL